MSFSSLEKRATTVVSLILSLRLLGLFMLLPIFSIYAIEYKDSSAFLAGLAIGIYALAQAIMQSPLAYLSDKFGRKIIVISGLVLFTVGSLTCYVAEDIMSLILGRVIQGCGAISSVGVATLSENTSPRNRASAFTIVGLSVGVSFVIGFLVGPIISSMFNFKILFLLLFIFGLLAIITTSIYYPKDNNKIVESKMEFKLNKNLIKIYSSSFMLSLVLSIFLFTYPLMWKTLKLDQINLSYVYLVIFLPAAILIYPMIRHLEKIDKINFAIKAGWFFLLIGFLSFISLIFNEFSLYLLGILFFLGSTIFQSVLPSLLSLHVSDTMRATGTGPFYVMSFLGHAIGSMFAGLIYSHSSYFNLPNYSVLILVSLLILIIWILIGMPKYALKK
ncbi:MAG: MFS transporter [Thermodesulfobacteriota bacteirum]|nr:MFS transporter [Thermodesulfobacteriota bacterium]